MGNIIKIYVLLIITLISGCVGTKSGAYRVFDDDLKRAVGKSLDKAYIFSIGYLSEEKPDEVKIFKNDTEQWIYYFKHNKNNNYEDCIVYISVDPKEKIVLNNKCCRCGLLASILISAE